MSSWQILQTTLAEWPCDVPAEPFKVSCHDRLRRALRDLRSGGPVGAGDLAGLVRHALHRESLLRRDETLFLRVPRGPGWPEQSEWAAHEMHVIRTRPGSHDVRALHWNPSWLRSTHASPLAAAFADAPRRRDAAIAADPAFKELVGHKFYSSPGQREAVRAAFFMKPGASLVVNLPTGAGKTLVIFAPAIAALRDRGLTVVIVPTVALARDLGRRMMDLLPAAARAPSLELAYHSGLEEEAKKAFRRRIRDGSQPIVFASPEAILGSLRGALFDATRAGRLRYFAVDEAHMISQWGDEFRPEFQLLSGLRAGLLSVCPPSERFRTLLLTGTLTEDAWWTLWTLFGRDEVDVVSAVHLRPEPRYFIHRANGEDERRQRVEEAVRRAPRPLILYTSRRRDAEWWEGRLGALGMRRVGRVIGGDMATPEGERLLEAWGAREIDAIVATSAFGLGMDQSDVRTVIHACIPETLDRYYQEVGRGGRDGQASAAILIYTDGDRSIAEGLVRDRIIGIDRGLDRWKAMWARREPIAGAPDVFEVPLDAKPSDIQQDSEANAAWNRRTLVLMARAGFIKLDTRPPPEIKRNEGEDDSTYEARCRKALEQYFERSAIGLEKGGHRSREAWQNVVDPMRKASMRADRDAADQMNGVLEDPSSLSDVLRRVYSIKHLGIGPEVIIPRASTSWVEDLEPAAYALPRATPITRTAAVAAPEFLRALGVRRRTHFVSYRTPSEAEIERWRASILEFLRRAVIAGFCEIAAGRDWLANPDYGQLSTLAPLRFIAHQDIGEIDDAIEKETLPRVSLLEISMCRKGVPEHLLDIDRPVHILLVPEDAPDHPRLDRRFIDVREHSRFEALFERLDA
jgi:superfamily II DNA/RNA helicase